MTFAQSVVKPHYGRNNFSVQGFVVHGEDIELARGHFHNVRAAAIMRQKVLDPTIRRHLRLGS
jgi:hypothetical protein